MQSAVGVVNDGGRWANFSIAETACEAAAMDLELFWEVVGSCRSWPERQTGCVTSWELRTNYLPSNASRPKHLNSACIFKQHFCFLLSLSTKAGVLQLQPNFQRESHSVHQNSCVISFTAGRSLEGGVLMFMSTQSWKLKIYMELEGNRHHSELRIPSQQFVLVFEI